METPSLQALSSSGRKVRGNSSKIRLDPEILDLARRQHGHVARWQLLELGASDGLIRGRLASGAWVTVHVGVYCIGPRRNDPVSRAAAAVLACGRGAVLSHASAASLWGFLPRWCFPLEVTSKDRRDASGHHHPSLPVVTATRRHPPTWRPHNQPRPDRSRHRAAASATSNSPAWSTTRCARRLPAPATLARCHGAEPLPPRHEAARALRRGPPQPDRLAARGRLPRLRQEVRPTRYHRATSGSTAARSTRSTRRPSSSSSSTAATTTVTPTRSRTTASGTPRTSSTD